MSLISTPARNSSFHITLPLKKRLESQTGLISRGLHVFLPQDYRGDVAQEWMLCPGLPFPKGERKRRVSTFFLFE